MATDQDIAELTQAARELIQRLDSLVDGTGDQLVNLAETARTNRRFIWLVASSLALDVLLTIAISVGLAQVTRLTSRVNETQRVTQQEALCPLYQQFVNADTPKARVLAGKAGQDLSKRDEAFRVIRHGYEVLNCSK